MAIKAITTTTIDSGVFDYTQKRADYKRYGIAEYWQFDSTRGEYHDTALVGDHLVEGRYQPIEFEWSDKSHCRRYSEALGLYLCWELGELRSYDPGTQSYLRAHNAEVARADPVEAELRRLRERLAALDDATDCS